MRFFYLLLICGMTGIAGTAPAQRLERPRPAVEASSLVDPHILTLADGRMRPNKMTGLSEAYLTIIDNS